MPHCFAYGCTHHTAKRFKCKLYRFPVEQRKRKHWIDLCRRADRGYKYAQDRLCSCHFKDGIKANGPTIFCYSKPTIPDIPKRPKSIKAASDDVPHLVADEDIESSMPADQVRDEVAVQCQTSSTSPVPEKSNQDHEYCLSCRNVGCQALTESFKDKEVQFTSKIVQLELEIAKLKLPITITNRLSVSKLKDDRHKILLYTSLTYDVFEVLLETLRDFQPLNYYAGWTVSLPLEDQLLITLMKLQLNCKDLDLADRFNISRSTVSNILHTIICALHEILFDGCLKAVGMPSRVKCKESAPKSFKLFPTARVAMDCTEITQDISSDLNIQSMEYSSYKSRHTVKALTCVAPNGVIVYVSDLYPGSVSDAGIVTHSKVLEHFVAGDLILADKGFNIYDKLPAGVHLNIPPFLKDKNHFTKEEAESGRNIARCRIHVERANARIKNFDILNHLPHHYRALSTKIFQLCCVLVNFQTPLLQESETAFRQNQLVKVHSTEDIRLDVECCAFMEV